MKNSIFQTATVSQLLAFVAVLFLIAFNVSHCTQQAGIDRSMNAAEQAERNTDFISDVQTMESGERKTDRETDSVQILEQSEKISGLKNELQSVKKYDSANTERKAREMLDEIIRRGKSDNLRFDSLFALFKQENEAIGELMQMAENKTDTVTITKTVTVRDTVYRNGNIREYASKPHKRRKVKHKPAKIHRTRAAKNGGK